MHYYIDTTVEREYSREELQDLWNGVAKPMWTVKKPTLNGFINSRNWYLRREWEDALCAAGQDPDYEWLDDGNKSGFSMSIVKWENAVVRI